MSNVTFDSFEDGLLRGKFNFATDQIYVMLVDSTYVPNQGAHQYRSDVSGEVTGTGYTAGGQLITATLTKDTTNHKNILQLGAGSWPSSTITARGAVYYKKLGGAATADPIIMYDDFGANVSNTNGTYGLGATSVTLNTPV